MTRPVSAAEDTTMRFQTAAITDEFSIDDLGAALQAMRGVGMTGAELRVVYGRNVMDLTDAELGCARTAVEGQGMRVLSIASPLLKCVLPDAPPIDARFQQDVFGSVYTFADQPTLTRRAFEVAEQTGAGIIRVFSYWRTVDPGAVFDRVAAALRDLADQAQQRGMVIGLENEHACNVGTGAEAARMLAAVDHPALGLIWDPANASILGETPYPDGYRALPRERIVHVHAKDCIVQGQTPTWGPLGEMAIDWTGQIDALARDGYAGAISLETHWRGPAGDRLEASTICGRNLRALVGG
jgi:L-ribulose-5-phosphate 3-epimerase